MRLKRATPEIYKVPLNDCSTDMAFRFPDATGNAYMRLPYDGSDIYAMYKFQVGSDEQAIEEIVDTIAIYNEDLYYFNASDEIDADWVKENLEEFWAFISLTTGVILLTHRNEVVIPLNAELTVEDMRI